MQKLKLQKAIACSLIAASTLVLNPMGANAEWKQDSNGWWNTEGSSWSIGWKEIDGQWYYFDNNGYMKTGWIQCGDKWYYLDSSGAMAKNTTVNGYKLGSDGAWIQGAETTKTGQVAQTNRTTQNTTTTEVIRKGSQYYLVEEPSIPMPSNVNSNATTIAGVTGVKFDDITKIVFHDGRGGEFIKELITVNDKQKIKEFMGYLSGYSIKKVENPERAGWVHNADFYINDKKVMDISFVDPLHINCECFDVTQGALDSKTFDKYLKSVDPSYVMMDEYEAYEHSYNSRSH